VVWSGRRAEMVEFVEYRVDGGDRSPEVRPFHVSEVGAHVGEHGELTCEVVSVVRRSPRSSRPECVRAPSGADASQGVGDREDGDVGVAAERLDEVRTGVECVGGDDAVVAGCTVGVCSVAGGVEEGEAGVGVGEVVPGRIPSSTCPRSSDRKGSARCRAAGHLRRGRCGHHALVWHRWSDSPRHRSSSDRMPPATLPEPGPWVASERADLGARTFQRDRRLRVAQRGPVALRINGSLALGVARACLTEADNLGHHLPQWWEQHTSIRDAMNSAAAGGWGHL